LTDSEIW